jgi:hypothetical protein
VLAFPETRAAAQGLWSRFVLNHVEVVRLDLSKLPLRTRVTMGLLEEPVSDADQAERKAGFRPNLPPFAVLGVSPELMVSGPATVEQTISVHDIESALAKAGASDVRVPAEWDSVTLRADIGSTVTAKYPDGSEIIQIQPIELQVPAGFPLEHFAEVAFLSIGVSLGGSAWHGTRVRGSSELVRRHSSEPGGDRARSDATFRNGDRDREPQRKGSDRACLCDPLDWRTNLCGKRQNERIGDEDRGGATVIGERMGRKPRTY